MYGFACYRERLDSGEFEADVGCLVRKSPAELEIMDQAGADTYLGVYQYLEDKLGKTCFKPPQLLKKQVESGRLGLKTSSGFYDYGPGAADAVRRDRDRKFYARLKLVRREWEQEK